jgi:hypothetical protein
MFEVFNMGIGFCYVVEAGCAERTLAILKAHGRVAQVIGTAISDPQKIVRIPARRLAGQHKRFWREDAAARGEWGDCTGKTPTDQRHQAVIAGLALLFV